MANPTDCEFAILGCTASNLGGNAYPFVLIVVDSAKERSALKSYVVNGWQNIREFFPDDVREDVLFFLDSLKNYTGGLEAKRFFDHLPEISVGPIRFLSGGACSPDELDVSVSALLDNGQAPVLWPESFRAI